MVSSRSPAGRRGLGGLGGLGRCGLLVVLVVVAMVVLVTISRGRCGSSTYCVCSPKLQTNSSLHP